MPVGRGGFQVRDQEGAISRAWERVNNDNRLPRLHRIGLELVENGQDGNRDDRLEGTNSGEVGKHDRRDRDVQGKGKVTCSRVNHRLDTKLNGGKKGSQID